MTASHPGWFGRSEEEIRAVAAVRDRGWELLRTTRDPSGSEKVVDGYTRVEEMRAAGLLGNDLYGAMTTVRHVAEFMLYELGRLAIEADARRNSPEPNGPDPGEDVRDG